MKMTRRPVFHFFGPVLRKFLVPGWPLTGTSVVVPSLFYKDVLAFFRLLWELPLRADSRNSRAVRLVESL